MRHVRGSRSSKYKSKKKKIVHKVEVVQTLPNINPSIREIWKFMSDGRVMYRKRDVVANLEEEDGSLDLETALPDLVQDCDFTFEEIVQFMHFLPSLLSMCKARNINVINIPIMPSLEDYRKWKDDVD